MLPALLAIFAIACQNPSSTGKKADKDSVIVSMSGLTVDNGGHPSAEIIEKGRQVFTTLCMTCHKDSMQSNVPGITLLAGMTPRAILAALDNGKMREVTANLAEDQRQAVAQFITNQVLTDNNIPRDIYTPFKIAANYNNNFDYSGWGGDPEGTGFRTSEQAGINPSNVASLKLKWAFAFPDATQVRCKPALIENWLIAGSQFGDVYAINVQTGKPGWHFTADAPIRGAIAVTKNADAITAYFADYNTNVYAVDVNTGKLLWKTRTGYHQQSAVTGSVAVYNDTLFVPITSAEVISAKNPAYECCTSSGGLVAVNASSGKIIWQYKVIAEAPKPQGKKKNGDTFYGPSGAPVWGSPTVDAKRGLVYIGTGENYTAPATTTSDAIQAIDMKTGKLVWNFQGNKSDTWNLACPGDPNCPDMVGPDLDFGMAPLLIHKKDGKDILVAGEKSGVVFGLSPEGKLLWEKRIGKGGALGGIHWGMATDGKYVYAANADNIYALDTRDSLTKPTPGIYALGINNGNVIWSTPAPACDTTIKGCLQSNSAAPTVIPGVVFAGGLDGHMRAYSTKDGKILWDYNTLRQFETVNKIKGSGGALDGAAPVVANGMLFVNSGYGMFGELQGNVLLAFEVDKK